MTRLILVISLSCASCFPRNASAQLSAVEIGVMAGNMLDIYPGMPSHRTQKSAFGAVRWGKQSPYRELYGNPEHGVLASFHDLGNTSILGYGIGLQYQVSFNQYITKRWRTFERINVGGIVVTKPYHFIDNPQNLVFGSYGSALITATAGVRYKFRQNAITAQASYWHSSNAHTTLPNVGMNTPMLMLGFEHFFWIEDVFVIDTTHKSFTLPAQWGIIARLGLGRNEAGGTVRPTNGSKYHKQLLAVGASYRYKTIHRLSFNIEAYHDETYALWNETMQWSQNSRFLGASALMFMVGHEFIYGHFGMVIQAGVNVYNPTLGRLIGEVERPTFSNQLKRYVPGRFALRYYVNKDENSLGSVFLQAAVKSNMGQADFLELGLGTIISGRQVER
ncbi:MAG: acyloxyacyl hydrolase [Cryomorphaceae bacterium]